MEKIAKLIYECRGVRVALTKNYYCLKRIRATAVEEHCVILSDVSRGNEKKKIAGVTYG